jgi:hypothetical protein
VAPKRSIEDDLAESAMKRAGVEVLRCPRCDKVILDDVPICRSCGAKFGKYRPRFPVKAAVFGLIALILVIALLMMR